MAKTTPCPICGKLVADPDSHLHEVHHYSSNNLAHLQTDWTTDISRADKTEEIR